jgi:hypothetical protein
MFDRGAEFCQAMLVIRLPRKVIAVLLAIWLPLFSGNALAASIAMQSMSGDCHVVKPVAVQHGTAPSSANHSHLASTTHQHMQLAADRSTVLQAQQSHQHDQQDPAHNDCGVCQLACCGYLAAVTIVVAQIHLSGQLFAPASMQFQSITSAPLDPPPLARV